MANVFRAPLLTPPPKSSVLGVDLFPNLLLTTLAVVAALTPFRPVDLPTPMRARTVTQTDIPPNLLTTTLRKRPFRQLDWPNPLRARIVQTADSGEISLPLLNAAYGGSAATAEDFPNPPGRKYWPQVDLPPNLLLSTLSAPVPKPFAQTDWTNPARRPYLQLEQRQAYMVSGITWDTRVLLWDSAAITWDGGAMGALPFLVPDQANQPTRRPYWQVDQVVNPLPSRTTATQAPFSQLDWPTPARARSTPLGESGEVSLSLLNAAYGGSAATSELFPNPIGRKYWAADDSPQNLLASTLKPGAANPFPPVDQSAPQPRRPVLQIDPVPNALILGIPASVAAPFAQLEWPLPARARFVPMAESGEISLPLLNAAYGGSAATADDFPNPPGRKYWQPIEQPPNLLTGTLAPAPGVPFYQTDWPNPTYRATARTFPAASTQDGIRTVTPAPFAQSDWPNPPPRARATPQGHEQSAAVLYLPVQTLAPFAQFDWPLIARARATPPIDYVVNAPMLAPLAVGPLTAIQDWPMTPPRRQIPVEIAPNLVLTLLAQAPAPFRLIDWPNPSARRATPQALEQSARGLYIPPPVVLPFALRDWPNPVRARRGDPSDTVENLAMFIGHPTTTLTGSAYWLIESPARNFSKSAATRFFTIAAPARQFRIYSNMPQATFPSKDPSEAVRLTFDMTKQLAALPIANTVLTGISSVTIAPIYGIDASLVQNGAPALSSNSLLAIVPVLGGANATDYAIRVVMTTTDPLTILELTGILPVRS